MKKNVCFESNTKLKPIYRILLFLVFIILIIPLNKLVSQNTTNQPIIKNNNTKSYLPNFKENSVVKIFSFENFTIKNYPGSRGNYFYYSMPSISHGSGIIIDSSGFILTAKHVTEPTRLLSVKIPGNNLIFPAEIVYKSDITDYAFLVIKGNYKNYTNLPPKYDSLHLGQQIWTYGYPIISGEPEPNITKGIITRFSKIYNMWQFDAYINPGNSGGPLITDNGDICGVVVSGIGDQNMGLNFALDMDGIITTYNNLKDEGSLLSRKIKLEKISPDMYNARGFLSKFFSNLNMQRRSFINDKDFETLKTDMSAINDTNQMMKEWAIYKEISASVYYNKAIDILWNNEISYLNARNLDNGELESYKELLQKSKSEIDIAKSINGSSSEVLNDLIYFITRSLELISYTPPLKDPTAEYKNFNDEIEEIEAFSSSILSGSEIKSIISYIGSNSNDFKRQYNNPKEVTYDGNKYYVYPKFMVRFEQENISSITFNSQNLPNDGIPAFKNINPHSLKSEFISTFGPNIFYKTGSFKDINEIYEWSLNKSSNIWVFFDKNGLALKITIQKK